ncbi:MAG: phosphoribosylglycinamide formyltransferase [Pseudomonadales bacterium]|nr:phosphoribosylglycinamide formyltransferase [Pseudomonadales bacterium]MCP5331383.1 phosphoribosylglycinamide formyltransferase [Pseudomonadales bacterium]MCP5344392.1 phosphoribosylglycinamide formyltransferase [Pseudomonadales bacterium]
MSATPCSVVVLISGNGSNLQALIDHAEGSPYRISAVISNKADAFGLQRARKAGIPTRVLDHREFADRESFDQRLMAEIDAFKPDLLVLAGFMRILSAGFVQHYSGRVLNIHPSLLPAYRGTHTHERVLEAGEPEHGVSVHFVTEELDGGPVILQAIVPVAADDTRDSLASRVFVQEHRIYPKAVDWFASGRLCMRDNAAWLDGERLGVQGIREKSL